MSGSERSLWTVRALAIVLSLALGAVAARAPALQADYRPVGADWAERARTSIDPKAYALAHASRALAARDPAAARWARRALERAPGNAYAWLTLAWALALNGEDAGARAALATSYRFAPRSMPLAQSRAALAQRWWPEMPLADRRRLIDETRVARGIDPAAFNRMAALVPRLAAIHRLGE